MVLKAYHCQAGYFRHCWLHRDRGAQNPKERITTSTAPLVFAQWPPEQLLMEPFVAMMNPPLLLDDNPVGWMALKFEKVVTEHVFNFKVSKCEMTIHP